MSINKINSLIDEEHIKTLFSIFKNQNTEIRLVGGSIRDLLMNREIRDIDSATQLEPNDVLDLLKKNNIESNVHYIPIHSHPYFKKLGFKEKKFPIMNKYFNKCLSLPIHAGLTFKDQKKIIKIIKNYQNCYDFILQNR